MLNASRKTWSDEDVQTLTALTNQHHTIAEIAARMGRSVASIHNKQHTLGIGVVRNARGRQGPTMTAESADAVPAWLEQLRPVQLPAPERTRTTQTPGPFTLVAGDFHFPQHDPDSIAILLEVMRQLKPRELILNGDTVDLLAVSRYPKDQRYTWDLRQEVTAFHEFLHRAMTIGNAWGMTIRETEANHSGNGTASRWHRYLSDRVPVLYAHPDAEKLLNYETWFYPEWAPIALVESALIADDLLIIHGDMVRKHAAYSARGHAEKWHSSVMHSHTHRMGCSFERIPSVGNRLEQVRRAFEIGCMCNLQPSYVSAPNWTNGFAIIQHGDAPTQYGVELVTVSNAQATVVALGQTIRA